MKNIIKKIFKREKEKTEEELTKSLEEKMNNMWPNYDMKLILLMEYHPEESIRIMAGKRYLEARVSNEEYSYIERLLETDEVPEEVKKIAEPILEEIREREKNEIKVILQRERPLPELKLKATESKLPKDIRELAGKNLIKICVEKGNNDSWLDTIAVDYEFLDSVREAAAIEEVKILSQQGNYGGLLKIIDNYRKNFRSVERLVETNINEAVEAENNLSYIRIIEIIKEKKLPESLREKARNLSIKKLEDGRKYIQYLASRGDYEELIKISEDRMHPEGIRDYAGREIDKAIRVDVNKHVEEGNYSHLKYLEKEEKIPKDAKSLVKGWIIKAANKSIEKNVQEGRYRNLKGIMNEQYLPDEIKNSAKANIDNAAERAIELCKQGKLMPIGTLREIRHFEHVSQHIRDSAGGALRNKAIDLVEKLKSNKDYRGDY